MSVAALTATTKPATALTWNWSYSGAGITAGGTFTTVDMSDGSGFYLITGIAGVRNDAVILGLQPAGTPIPGNEPFSVDNLVRLESPQLTVHGFGYAIAGGTFSNPFFANFLQPPEYLEFFSAPPLTPGVTGPEDSELPIRFSATLAPVPQTATWALLLAGLGMLGLTARCRRHCRVSRPRNDARQSPLPLSSSRVVEREEGSAGQRCPDLVDWRGCHGDGGYEWGARGRRALMLPILCHIGGRYAVSEHEGNSHEGR